MLLAKGVQIEQPTVALALSLAILVLPVALPAGSRHKSLVGPPQVIDRRSSVPERLIGQVAHTGAGPEYAPAFHALGRRKHGVGLLEVGADGREASGGHAHGRHPVAEGRLVASEGGGGSLSHYSRSSVNVSSIGIVSVDFVASCHHWAVHGRHVGAGAWAFVLAEGGGREHVWAVHKSVLGVVVCAP